MAGQKSLNVPAERTWNMCMLAHVDHGKSALSDCLISSNGIISDRSAGKVRYMDSRPDEQLRGITMKSSSIALGHRESQESPLNIVHLTDSPGHVDFSGEVEAALRICDGAILVVDVVEGVCVQTVTVLRAALEHAVQPVLVLNKLDRLFSELYLTPIEAYRKIQSVIEQVNVIMGVRQLEEMMGEADLVDQGGEWTLDYSDCEQNESGYFSPEKGNVAFASAIDGWAFRIVDFAEIFSKRFGISHKVLCKTLWGNYYLQPKNKKIVRKTDITKGEPMFSKFILSSIHSIYEQVHSSKNDYELALTKRANIVKKLGIKVSERDIRNRNAEAVIHSIMGAWLPASTALMKLITDKLPSAAQGQANPERLAVMWPHLGLGNEMHRKEAFERQHKALRECASDDTSPVMAVVTKMIEGPSNDSNTKSKIRQPKSREELDREKAAGAGKENEEKAKMEKEEDGMIAFARLLSGNISVGQKLYAYGPKYRVQPDGTYDESTVSQVQITSLHLLMGRSSENLRSADAGCIIGLGGLGESVLKTATISSETPGSCLPAGTDLQCAGLHRDAVVRVAVEPHLPKDKPIFMEGLRKLNQSDPSVETHTTDKGEYIISASGELHLERCLKDLREKFAKKIKIHVSKPIVSFRETVVGGISPYMEDDSDDSNDDDEKKDGENGEIPKADVHVDTGTGDWDTDFLKFGKVIVTDNSEFTFRMFAAPLGNKLSKALDEAKTKVQKGNLDDVREKLIDAVKKDSEGTNSKDKDKYVKYWTEKVLRNVWACGPTNFGANLLIGTYACSSSSANVEKIFHGEQVPSSAEEGEDGTAGRKRKKELERAILAGFQIGVQSGPLAEEPMYGVAIFVDKVSVKACEDDVVRGLGGKAISCAKEGVKNALLNCNARIMEGVLDVDISVQSEMLGATYTVIGKRRGRVLEEELRDGVNIFGITALLPITESYGFADVLRKKTSGFAIPQMVFSHWECMELDPFWMPTTLEEIEELGKADTTAENNNLARKLINGVRRRKGLRVEEKIVESGEKQRTLSRKK